MPRGTQSLSNEIITESDEMGDVTQSIREKLYLLFVFLSPFFLPSFRLSSSKEKKLGKNNRLTLGSIYIVLLFLLFFFPLSLSLPLQYLN